MASGRSTTAYWYGASAIGEFGSSTAYYLVDGNGSVRQVVDQNASVVFARYYDPFGQILNQNGTDDTLYGYLGAQFDKVIGLMYIDGRYYDPITGRFLSPSNGGQNPYVPFAGLSLAPFILIAVLRRRRKGPIWTGWLVIAVLASVALGVAACEEQPAPSQPQVIPNPPSVPTTPSTSMPVPIPSSTPVPPTATPLPTPTPTCTPTATPSPLPGDLPRRWFIAEDHNKPDNPKVKNEKDVGYTCSPTALFIVLRYAGLETDWNTVISKVDAVPPEQGGLDDNWRTPPCSEKNHVCTSLQVIEMVARTYASNVDAHENWEKEDIMRYIKQDTPVMVNYGGADLRSTGHSLVAYGYDLDAVGGETFWFLDPMSNSVRAWKWNDFELTWKASDYGDPLRRNPDGKTYRPYYHWALAIPK